MEVEVCALAPPHWKVKTIEDVCIRVTSGGTPSRREPSYYIDGCWPWVKTKELQDKWIYDTMEHITDEAVSRSSAKVLEPCRTNTTDRILISNLRWVFVLSHEQ